MRKRINWSENLKFVAIVASLSLVLGGGAYAASKISGSRLKGHSVSEKKLKKSVIHKLNRKAPVPPGVPKVVTSLPSQGFEATNSSCSLTPDGVECGPYADGGAAGGSVCYSGLNGQPFSALKSLVYVGRYTSVGDTGGVGVPYLRVFLNSDANDAIFSPNTQAPDPDVDEGPFHTWAATSGGWRYDDDPGNGGDDPFATVRAAHSTELISSICITTGFTNGVDLNSLVRSFKVNGNQFNLGS